MPGADYGSVNGAEIRQNRRGIESDSLPSVPNVRDRRSSFGSSRDMAIKHGPWSKPEEIYAEHNQRAIHQGAHDTYTGLAEDFGMSVDKVMSIVVGYEKLLRVLDRKEMNRMEVVNCNVCKYTTERNRWEIILFQGNGTAVCPTYATTEKGVEIRVCPHCGALVDVSKQEQWDQTPT